MLNDCSRGYLQNYCYSNQLSGALLHVSYPPAQTCGGEDILYIFFLIFPGHQVLDPITDSYLGPLVDYTLLQEHNLQLNQIQLSMIVIKQKNESKFKFYHIKIMHMYMLKKTNSTTTFERKEQLPAHSSSSQIYFNFNFMFY